MRFLIALLALIAVIVHVWLSRELHNGRNEIILKEHIQPAIDEMNDVSIRYDYLDGILEGTVSSVNDYHTAEEYAKNHKRAGRIFNNLKVRTSPEISPPVQPALPNSPPNLDITLNQGRIFLQGRVPNQLVRSRLETAASRLGVGSVVNQLTIDDNVQDPNWLGDIPGLMSEFFANTDAGEIEAKQQSLRLRRTVRSSATKRSLMSKAGETGLAIIDEVTLLRERPANFIAVLRNNRITLSGEVPSQRMKDNLGRALSRNGFEVINNLRISEDTGEPSWINGAFEFSESFFRGAKSGELEISSDGVRLSREVDDVSIKNSFANRAKTLFPSSDLIDQLQLPDREIDFNFVITRDRRDVNLTGWLPSLDMKNDILRASRAKFSGLTINDKIKVAPTVKMPKWGPSLPEFIGTLDTDLDTDIRFDPTGIDLKGIKGPERQKLVDAADESFGKKFPGFRLPKFGFNLKRLGRRINMDGWLPDQNLKDKIVTGVKRKFPGSTVEDKVQIDRDITLPEWGPALPEFIGSLDDEFDSNFNFDSDGIKLEGVSGPKRSKILDIAKRSFRTKHSSFDLPYFGVDVNQGNDVVRVDGWLSDPVLKKIIINGVEEKFPGKKVIDSLKIDQEISMPDWAPALPDFFATLDTDFDGDVSFDTNGIELGGFKGKAREKVLNSARRTLGTGNGFFQTPQFAFDLQRQGNRVKMEGWLPDPEIKTIIVEDMGRNFPTMTIEDNLRIDPEIAMPVWGASLPDFVGSINDWNGIDGLKFDDKGIKLDKVRPNRKTDVGNLARSKFGLSFPTNNLPKPNPNLPARVLAVLDDDMIVLTGKVPTRDMKNSIGTAVARSQPRARLTNDIVVDSMVKSPVWSGGVSNLIGDFLETDTKTAEFEIDPEKLRLRKVMPDQPAKARYIARAGNVFPGGRLIDQLSIAPRPVTPVVIDPPVMVDPNVKPVRSATLRAQLSPEKVRLEGEVPDQPGRRSVVRGAETAFPDVRVEDELIVSPEVHPAPWLNQLGDVFSRFSKHAKEGEIQIDETSMKISGVATTPNSRDKLLAELAAAMPRDMDINDRMKVDPCKDNPPPVEDDYPKFVVYYATGSSKINSAGKKEVKEAVDTIRSFGGTPSILVKGFTDSQGNAAANKRLSDKRAKGVVDSLVAQNVDPSLIRYIGVGQTESRGGANKNDRRVEIIVIQLK